MLSNCPPYTPNSETSFKKLTDFKFIGYFLRILTIIQCIIEKIKLNPASQKKGWAKFLFISK
tara:strand:- start:6232 stop:6417 length:186 start_codon:yes stop_codon:yes gene_type:complete